MGSWVWKCTKCNSIFLIQHFEEGLENYFLPIKPTFPEGGQSMNCPHCGHSAMYRELRSAVPAVAHDADLWLRETARVPGSGKTS
jgi:DNA-directed RNA polymerase subunit RPC12/RpoP